MTIQRSTPQPNEVRVSNGLDVEITLSAYVDPALGFPSGVHIVVTIPTTSGIPDVVDMLGSSIPLTLSGITSLQFAKALKDCAIQARALKGYA